MAHLSPHPSPQAGPTPPPAETTLLEHLLELRQRLLYALCALGLGIACVYPFAAQLFAFLVRPLAHLLSPGRHLIYTGLAEAFLTYLKVAFFGGFVLSAPVILAQVWLFVAPALYRHERHLFLGFLSATPLLFLAGAALAYSVICPLAFQFFLSFEGSPLVAGGLPIRLEARVSEYLSLVMTTIAAFGLSFQLPVLLILLARIGTVDAARLRSFRKYAFLAIVIVAALITPPDLFSPLSLILPLYGLYELSILCVALMARAT